MRQAHTKAYTVTMTVRAPQDATAETIKSLIRDLEWVGGCRDPDEPAFSSLTPTNINVKRAKEKDK